MAACPAHKFRACQVNVSLTAAMIHEIQHLNACCNSTGQLEDRQPGVQILGTHCPETSGRLFQECIATVSDMKYHQQWWSLPPAQRAATCKLVPDTAPSSGRETATRLRSRPPPAPRSQPWHWTELVPEEDTQSRSIAILVSHAEHDLKQFLVSENGLHCMLSLFAYGPRVNRPVPTDLLPGGLRISCCRDSCKRSIGGRSKKSSH